MATNVTSKGQVTIPKRVRDASGIKPGKSVIVEYVNGQVVIRLAVAAGKSDYGRRLDKVRGTFKSNLSTDEIMALLRGD